MPAQFRKTERKLDPLWLFVVLMCGLSAACGVGGPSTDEERSEDQTYLTGSIPVEVSSELEWLGYTYQAQIYASSGTMHMVVERRGASGTEVLITLSEDRLTFESCYAWIAGRRWQDHLTNGHWALPLHFEGCRDDDVGGYYEKLRFLQIQPDGTVAVLAMHHMMDPFEQDLSAGYRSVVLERAYDLTWAGSTFRAVFYERPSGESWDELGSNTFVIYSIFDDDVKILVELGEVDHLYSPARSPFDGWGDINGDGQPDIAIERDWPGTSPCSHDTVVFQLNRRGELETLPLPTCTSVSVDANNDGRAEIRVGSRLDTVLNCPVHWACWVGRDHILSVVSLREVNPIYVGDRYIEAEPPYCCDDRGPYEFERLYLAYVDSGREEEGRRVLSRLTNPACHIEYSESELEQLAILRQAYQVAPSADDCAADSTPARHTTPNRRSTQRRPG